MNRHGTFAVLVSGAALCAATLVCSGASRAAQDQGTNPDNTRVNKRDRSSSEATADNQKENRSDRDLSRNVRRAIMKDKSLSTYAHNIKVIAQNGMVTLKGPVRSEDEKMAIEAKAAEVAGKENVKSEISVAPKDNSGSK